MLPHLPAPTSALVIPHTVVLHKPYRTLVCHTHVTFWLSLGIYLAQNILDAERSAFPFETAITKHSCFDHSGEPQAQHLRQAGSDALQGLIVQFNVVQGRFTPAPILLHHPMNQLAPPLTVAEPRCQRPASNHSRDCSGALLSHNAASKVEGKKKPLRRAVTGAAAAQPCTPGATGRCTLLQALHLGACHQHATF